MCKWKVGNYVGKESREILWLMPKDKDPNDPKQRHYGISPGNALKILNTLPQTPEVLAIKAVAEACSKKADTKSNAAPPPLPGERKFYVAYPGADGRMARQDVPVGDAEIVELLRTHKSVIVAEVGGKTWHSPAEFGITLTVAPVVKEDTPPALPSDEPPPINGSSSGEDLMKRVMQQRKAS